MALQRKYSLSKSIGMALTLYHSTHEAYETAVNTLFKSLDRAEAHLSKSSGKFYYGEHITEADVRLYTVRIVNFEDSNWH